MRQVIYEMTRPLAEIAVSTRTKQIKMDNTLENVHEDTQKLNGAIFYKDKRHRNIFHIMNDKITDMSGKLERHEKRIKG